MEKCEIGTDGFLMLTGRTLQYIHSRFDGLNARSAARFKMSTAQYYVTVVMIQHENLLLHTWMNSVPCGDVFGWMDGCAYLYVDTVGMIIFELWNGRKCQLLFMNIVFFGMLGIWLHGLYMLVFHALRLWILFSHMHNRYLTQAFVIS